MYEILIQVALDLWIILNDSECFIILIILINCLKMAFLSLRVNVLRVPTKEGEGLLLCWLYLDLGISLVSGLQFVVQSTVNCSLCSPMNIVVTAYMDTGVVLLSLSLSHSLNTQKIVK